MLAEIRSSICGYVARLDASALSGTEALARLRELSAIKNAAAVGEALLAARIEETKLHKSMGHRSAAELLGRETGTTAGAANDKIQTGARLADQPDLDAAARRGEFSAEETSTMAGAGAASPGAEKDLMHKARAGASLNEIRDEANKIKANALGDREARRKQIHDERHIRAWTDAQGAGNLRMRDNPEVIARVMARVDEETDVIFAERRRDGTYERREAYAADALVRIVTGTAKPAKSSGAAKVIFRCDWPAWLRGYPVGDEVMELIGYGPVAASAIDEAIEAGGFIAAVITNGGRLTGVAHLGRAPTAKQQSALEWLYPTCAALGCSATARLERDHRVDWADTHITMLDWLDRLCRHHHDLKTRKNWMLVDGRGTRAFVPPEDPRHQSNSLADANAPP